MIADRARKDLDLKRAHLTPVIILGLIAALSTIAVLSLALSRPWIGMTLAGESETVVIRAIDDMRSADDVQPGDRVIALSGNGQSIVLVPSDLIEEPDGLPTTADMAAHFAKSGRLNALLTGASPEFVLDRDGTQVSLPARIADSRPISDLPAVFWVQILVGVCSMLIGGWLMALRPRDQTARWMMLAGVGLMAASHAAALYSTRELALPEQVFAWASRANSAGALSFGLGMVCLFLTYPVRYVPKWIVRGVAVFFFGWIAFSFFRLGNTPAEMVHLPTLILMIGILLGAIGQVWATRGNPSARAAMRWFGLSVVVGAGSFVSLIVVPQVMGFSPQVSQGYAFALFLIVYVGLATGVARYRLFDLEFWAFRALFYAGGVALLLMLDALFVYAIAMDRVPAFSVSLLIVSFLYLPGRDYIGRVLTGRRALTTADLVDLVAEAALAPTAARQDTAMQRLLDELFHPMHIEPATHPVEAPIILDNGEKMAVPGLEGAADLVLHWAHKGRRLFSQRDLATARSVLQMAAQVVERRRAYEFGAAEERERIHRDMHDNIGAQLLGALHSSSAPRKDALIRQTLTDLREIVSNPGGDPILLQSLLGDLRGELSEHLSSVDITLSWETGGLPDMQASPITASSIRAVLREGVSNVLRHAGATSAEVRINVAPTKGTDHMQIEISDNGRGMLRETDAQPGRLGTGLRNLAARLEARGGTFEVLHGEGRAGVTLRADLPLQPASETLVTLRDAGE